jgi:hypothetical protein
MMKKGKSYMFFSILISIFLLATCVIWSSCTPTTEPQVEKKAAEPEIQVVTPKTEWSKEESEEIARQLLLGSPTFTSRGIDDSLRLLTSIPLEQPFAWQFEYEFNCRYAGYGRLGSEPTPQDVTPHEACIVVQEGEVIYAVMDEEWDVLLEISSETSSQEESVPRPSGNEVCVSFIEERDYKVSGDSFINKEVTTERWWRTNLLNLSDETGAPVIGVRLSLDSEMSFGGISGFLSGRIERDQLTTMGPPTYEWFLGDVPNGKTITTNGWPWDVFVVRYRFPDKLAPGYDVSRSFDKTLFSTPGIQTLTITLTPREESIDTVSITVHTDKDEFVDPVVLSYSSNVGGDVRIEQGGHRSKISFVPVELNTPMTVTVTLQVTPRVPLVYYKPHIGISTDRVSIPEEGITTGGSVSYTTEVGTWTWSAEGDYVWDWGIRASPDVSLSFSRNSYTISIWILIAVILGAIILGIILYRRRRKRVST